MFQLLCCTCSSGKCLKFRLNSPMHKISSTVFRICLCMFNNFLFLIKNLVLINPLLLNLCLYLLLIISKYFFFILRMFTKNIKKTVTSVIWAGIHPYINITLSKIRVPILKVNMVNTISARVIMLISMMVQIFINLKSLLHKFDTNSDREEKCFFFFFVFVFLRVALTRHSPVVI